ncbi:ParB/RepB/Spo0J family partition protein [Klenkia terrae]|uniref:ParB/RepB/Spo0J family partition protein n=1 Tax=Klenkia terrae TaxID=1052259 RepID=UPI0036219DF5
MNVRHTTTADTDLVASVTEHGVLVPIVAVRTAHGEVRVRMGHRRTLAAIEAGRATVPVVVVADETSDDAGTVHRLVTQWAENEHRAGLSNAERVDVIGQLSAFGTSPTQIARRTRASRADVTAALAVTASELARKATVRYDFLDLAQAATVAEFDTDPDAVQALVVAARDGRFDHVSQRLRDERTAAADRAAAADQLREAGLRVIDPPTTDTLSLPVHRLVNADGARPTVEDHRECPGHAAYVADRHGWVTPDGEPGSDGDEEDTRGVGERQWRVSAVPVFVCTDPAAHGHRDSWGTSGGGTADRVPVDQMTDAQREAARDERRDVVESNKAWGSAETVRREWLRGLACRKSAPKGTATFVAVALARDGDLLADVGGNHLAADLLGVPSGAYGRSVELAAVVDKATDARALLMTLVMVLAAYEGRTDRNDWRSRRASTGRYLTHLQGLGYALADVERRACCLDPQPSTD